MYPSGKIQLHPLQLGLRGAARTRGEATGVLDSSGISPVNFPEGDFGGVIRLLQRRVLRFGLPQDWDVGVGVFPKREDIFVGDKGPGAGGVCICPFHAL